jgi:murein L,D-transpeptidase YcbB/YkuD
LPDSLAFRARACLYGIASVALLWMLVLSAAVAIAQEPAPRYWDRQAAGTLLAYIERIDSHGLDPSDYGPAALEQAIASGNANALERQATESFSRVAVDLAIGHVRPGKRGRYYIASDTIDPARIARLIDTAIAARGVAHVLEALAPPNRQYTALRAALARLTPAQVEERRRILVSLERWRWLPRELGARHLLANIPEYRARLFEGEQETASHRIIVGKRQTPTPQFSAMVNAVVLNPSWHVPQSIVAESVGRLVRTNPNLARARGYIWAWDRFGKLQVTQMPGPQNALGQIKLDMPNAFSVYLHDTPNKKLFDHEDRTFSHGCIRTEDPFDLAVSLLTSPEWNRASIDEAIAARQTRRVELRVPVPVYAVYLTAVSGRDGAVRYLDDPYGLDAAIYAQLSDGR